MKQVALVPTFVPKPEAKVWSRASPWALVMHPKEIWNRYSVEVLACIIRGFNNSVQYQT